jgi:hypothetical protein
MDPYLAGLLETSSNAGTVRAENLAQLGFSPPLAVEIARQINLGTGRADYLINLGMPFTQAKALAENISARIPAGVGWPLATYPITIIKNGSTYSATVDAQSYVPTPFLPSATVYWVDVTAGNNGNSGLTEALAKQSINAAITAGNATSGPYRINVKAGYYNRNNSIAGSAGTVRITQDCAIIAYGGRVQNNTADALTFAVHDAPTQTGSVARSNVTRVFDRLNTNAFGDMVEFPSVADAATCVATPNSYALVSNTTLYVRRADGALPTNTNTMVLLNLEAAYFPNTSKNLYFEGVDFQGGNSGGVYVAGAARNVVCVDCTSKYAGSSASLVDGFVYAGAVGLMLFLRCKASANAKDGFNFHAAGGEAMYPLTIDCEGYDNGRYTSVSNNGWTSHEAVIGMDVNGYYHDNRNGSDLHNIATTKTALFGTRVTATDVVEGATSSAIKAGQGGDSAEMWLDGAIVSGVGKALYATGTASKIHKRNVTVNAGTQVADSGCTIDTY